MGEENRKKRRHANILESAIGCIYCAGLRSAEQVDHMPPRALFRMSQRPKGLEFPSCSICNRGTSKLDIVAAFMARSFPGIRDEADEAEWDRLPSEVRRAAPGLLEEIIVPRAKMEQMMVDEGVFDPNLAVFKADGPILGSYMQAFAAKVGFALRYEDTGKPVPKTGGVQVRWFTSYEILYDHLPESISKSIGTPRIMHQGKITSNQTFEYGWGDFINKPDIRLYFSKFREAFVVAAFVSDDSTKLPFPIEDLATFVPGELCDPLLDRANGI